MPQLSGVSILLLIMAVLFIMQSVAGYFQIKNYQKAVRRMHKFGNVGMGQKRGGFMNGHVAIIACDSEGIITAAEVMEGGTILARFKKADTFLGKPLVGTSIFDFIEITKDFNKKEFKKHQGYIRALEALEVRLTDRELTREQEKYMEKRGNKGRFF